MSDVIDFAGKEIIDASDLATIRQQPIAQMRAEEAGPTGDQCPFAPADETCGDRGSHVSFDIGDAAIPTAQVSQWSSC